MIWIVRKIRGIVKNDDGVTSIEYALIAALVAIVIVATVQVAGDNLLALFQSVAGAFS